MPKNVLITMAGIGQVLHLLILLDVACGGELFPLGGGVGRLARFLGHGDSSGGLLGPRGNLLGSAWGAVQLLPPALCCIVGGGNGDAIP